MCNGVLKRLAVCCLILCLCLTECLCVCADESGTETAAKNGLGEQDVTDASGQAASEAPEPVTFTQDRITYEIITEPDGDKDGTVRITKANPKKSVSELKLSAYVVYENHFYRVTEIGDAVFAFSKLEKIEMPWCMEKLGDACFYGATALKSLEFDVRLSSIGDACFSYCTALESITIDRYSNYFKVKKGIIYTADMSEVVSGVLASGDITINKNAVSVRPFAFEGNHNITSVKCNKGLKTIGEGAFYDCTQLKSVFISKTVTLVEGNPFAYCDALETLSIAAANKKYTVVDNLLLSASGKVVYSGMAASGAVTLPDTVRYISAYAFCGNTKITEIEFGSAFKAVRAGAFYDCRSLEYVRFNSSKTQVTGGGEDLMSFGNTTYNLEVSLPPAGSTDEDTLYESLKLNCPTKTIFTRRK